MFHNPYALAPVHYEQAKISQHYIYVCDSYKIIQPNEYQPRQVHVRYWVSVIDDTHFVHNSLPTCISVRRLTLF